MHAGREAGLSPIALHGISGDDRPGGGHALFASGCSAPGGRPFDPRLVGREDYLRRTTRFSPRFKAADSKRERSISGSHEYGAGPLLPAGTRVTVVQVGSSGIAFLPVDRDTTFRIEFSYGRKVMSPSAYFDKLLLESDPLDSLRGVSSSVLTAMHDGSLQSGMTTEQALMARGYPPAHRTPSLKANHLAVLRNARGRRSGVFRRRADSVDRARPSAAVEAAREGSEPGSQTPIPGEC